MFTSARQKLCTTVHNSFFRSVHNHCLIYNTCWEDPRIDRQLMQLDHNSRVAMITSAGCNALDYLLDAPAEIHTVDVNPRQNALLQLKLALLEYGDFDALFAMFGKGAHEAYDEVYAAVREHLPTYASAFWDKKIHYFGGNALKKSFYFHGTAGNLAWLMNHYLARAKKNLKRSMLYLLNADDLEQQRTCYRQMESELWTTFSRWLVQQPVVMTMMGVPKAQILLLQQYPGGIYGYIRDCLKHVFTEVLMKENYFWRVYLTGSYTKTCCPNYLKQEYFEALRAGMSRISTHTSTLTALLQQSSRIYTHFVLLDHQDWLAANDTAALQEEWEHILRRSQPGAKILMRSAGLTVDFLPPIAKTSLRFYPERTQILHQQDRVGTYGSLHFAEVC
jgi:S-adenosylmethionine-diacylglycerol 3-amino-3-carboxypropyl transferase